MFTLLETAIAFLAILITLSLLVKSLTSVVKSYMDYYSRHMEEELVNFLLSLSFVKDYKNVLENYFGDRLKGGKLDNLPVRESLPEELLDEDTVMALLGLDPEAVENDVKTKVKEARAKLKIFKANVRFRFANKMKQWSMLLGLGLCLIANINAFTIWQTLYSDANLRARYASQDYVDDIMQQLDKVEKTLADETVPNRATLEKRQQNLESMVLETSRDLSFGMGRIYKNKDLTAWIVLYELLGALLTGLLISIGAPYLHDLLRSLTEVRNRVKESKPAKS